MGQHGLTIEQMQEAVDAVAKYGSQNEAARQLGLERPTFLNRYRKGIKAGLDQAIVHPAPQGHTVKGVSTLYDLDGNVVQQWIKTKADGPSLDDIIAAIQGAFDEYDGKANVPPAPEHADADLATIIPLADFHVGLLSWRRETGEDWDLTIAQAIIKAAMGRLVASTTPSGECVILGLGDLLHSDGYDPVTSRSKNQLDVDGRWPKVLRAAVDLIIHTVDLALKRHAHVLLRILPGNHDEESAIAVAMALSLYYSANPRVSVDDDPSRFWWWSWGTTLLGATHGDKAKMKDLPLIMAARNPEAWGRAKHRHIMTGHIHHASALEAGGVTVESFQSPVARDAYHDGMGFTSGRSLTALTLHRDHGEIGRVKSNIVAA